MVADWNAPSQARPRFAQIRVLVVDDHPGVRAGLVTLIDTAPGLAVAGECEDGSEVVEAAERLRPEVVLMDVQMPRVDGLTATRALLRVHPDARVVILTSRGPAAERDAMAAGAWGFITKDTDPLELLDCIRRVAAGGSCWSSGARPVTDRSGR